MALALIFSAKSISINPDMEELSLLGALVAGLLSFSSPCVLPMVPVYLGSICGPEILEPGAERKRLPLFFHTLSFVIGFPEEEREDIDKTLTLALKTGIQGNSNPLIQLPTVLPGTELRNPRESVFIQILPWARTCLRFGFIT